MKGRIGFWIEDLWNFIRHFFFIQAPKEFKEEVSKIIDSKHLRKSFMSGSFLLFFLVFLSGYAWFRGEKNVAIISGVMMLLIVLITEYRTGEHRAWIRKIEEAKRAEEAAKDLNTTNNTNTDIIKQEDDKVGTTKQEASNRNP